MRLRNGKPLCAAPESLRLMKTADAREGMMSFVQRREAKFTGE